MGLNQGFNILMSWSDVEHDFPGLAGKQYDLSDEDFNYNCLAFALGDETHWWEPPKQPGQYWPPGFPDDTTISTVEAIIRCHGFTIELNAALTPQADAIAIYGIGNEWTHFAKFTAGKWHSKLGEGHDVVGFALDDLEIPMYGNVIKILRRPMPSEKFQE
jgi:hypothetical protein